VTIRIIHQYYKTPEDGGAIRSYHLANYFNKLGHEVSVITAFNEKYYQEKKIENVTVHYLPVYYTNHLSFLSRIHAFLRFYWQAKKLMKRLPQPDLNYVISTPLTTGFLALFGLNRQKTHYIFEVGDLWPEAPIQLGVIRNPLLKRATRSLEKKIYNKAKHIVALSTDIERIINQTTNTPTTCVTNIADTEYFKPVKNGNIKEKLGYKDKFVVGYIGTVGLANHLEFLLDAADACKAEPDIQFVIMGGGAQYDMIRQNAINRKLGNIDFYAEGDKDEARNMLYASDAVYVSFANAPVLGSGSPNKFFDGLAAGKLITINFEGWIKHCVERNECGFSYNPHNPENFFEKLRPYVDDNNLLENAQHHSLHVAQNYTKEEQFKRLENLIQFLNKA